MSFTPDREPVVKSWETPIKGIYRLLKAAQQQGAQTASLLRTPQVWAGGNATPPGSGGGGGQAFETWLYLVTTDQDVSTPWAVDVTDFGPGILRGLDFFVGQFAGLRVSVGVSGDLPQSDDGSEGYPSWVWTASDTITIHNLAAYTSAGGFIGDLVRVTALR